MKRIILLLVIVASVIGNYPAQALPLSTKQVGMWYSTLYSNEGDYLWSKGNAVDSTDRFTGDVNGDGKDDVVFFYNNGGVWHGLISNGNGFSLAANMAQGHAQGATREFLGDFNGDGCADAIAYWGDSGNWRVWLAHCHDGQIGFMGDNTIRISGHGVGSIDQVVGDVNGDGKSDAVIITAQGDWHAALSNGSQYTYAGQWKHGLGAGPQFKHFVSDVTGDGKGDADVFDGGNGNWYVSANTGVYNAAEGGSPIWRIGHGNGSTNQLLARADNNQLRDAVVYFDHQSGTMGSWYISESTGSSFGGNPLDRKITSHGRSARLDAYKEGGASWQGVGDFNGDGIDETVVFHNRGTDGRALGEWRVLTLRENEADVNTAGYNNAKYNNPDQLNYWQSNLISYRPIVNGLATQYDSGNTAVIADHLAKMDQAGIDYLLFDLTNGVRMGWVEQRAKTVCQQMTAYNQVHGTHLKFAIAQGAVQYHAGDPNMGVQYVEDEAGQVLSDFVDDQTCGPSYYSWQGKPFLVTYFNSVDQVKTWEAYSNKTNSSNFLMRYTLGSVPYRGAETYTSTNGGGCGTIPTDLRPWPAEWGYYAGWGMPWGSLTNSSMMVAMPGWYVHTSANEADNKRVSRTQLGTEGGFYASCGWDRILSAAPDMAVINSFNEFAEETGVEPADTSQLQGLSESWSSADKYWNMTKSYIQQYKQN